MATKYIGTDVAKVYDKAAGNGVIVTLYWGDAVEVIGAVQNGRTEIRFDGAVRFLGKDIVFTDVRPLKLRFVDVGQGDGAIVESPSGKLALIDGGEEGHLGHYMKRAFPGKRRVEAVVVTHGDADHFAGLTNLVGDPQRITVEGIFHNGLAKRPSDRPDEAMFGATAAYQGALYCSELVDDISTVPDSELNKYFRPWKKAVGRARNAAGASPTLKRLAAGAAFDPFPGENVAFEVLGPIEETIGGQPALRMLHDKPGSASYSASHTVNGHSIVLRLTYGNVRILFGADLNEESQDLLLGAGADLEAEVLKVPHHGSDDFSVPMLKRVSPVVSIVSSGDEDSRKDHIHPKAVLVGALGKASRIDKPLVLVTEMVAFIWNLDDADKKKARNAGISDAHRLVRKTEFGIVHLRTDGKRLLVVTRGAEPKEVEAYAYSVTAAHVVTTEKVRKA